MEIVLPERIKDTHPTLGVYPPWNGNTSEDIIGPHSDICEQVWKGLFSRPAASS